MVRSMTADAAVETLLNHGVDTIYGVPGIHNDHLFDAFWRKRDRLRVLHARHEQTAGYMALGAAMATGAPQVFSVVPGPGVLNASAAMLTASSLSAPVVGLFGQIPQADIDRGLGHLHELHDQPGLLRHFVKSAERIETPSQAGPVIARAFQTAQSGRPGVAAVECAIDMWGKVGEASPAQPLPIERPPVDAAVVDRMVALILEAKRPMIVVGGGAKDAGREVAALAEWIGAPVHSFRGGRDVIPAAHPLSITHPIAHRLWKDTDLVLSIGSRMFAQKTGWGVDDALKVLRIDIDPAEPDRMRRADAGLIADSVEGAAALLAALKAAAPRHQPLDPGLGPHREWMAGKLAALQPQADFLAAIRAALPDDAIVVDDVTQLGFAGRLGWETRTPRSYLSPGYQDNLGWAYGAALGAKAARPNQAVVAVVGDGGFMYQAAEMATAMQHGIAVIAVVFDNAAFGNVKLIQAEHYGERFIASDLTNPDFVDFAKSFGAATWRAETPAALGKALEQAVALNKPALIHVPCGDMASPWDMILMPRVRG